MEGKKALRRAVVDGMLLFAFTTANPISEKIATVDQAFAYAVGYLFLTHGLSAIGNAINYRRESKLY